MAYLKIRTLRKKKKLTQKNLADICNLSASAIGMYEQGRREPDMKTLLKLSEALETSLNEILVTKKSEDEYSMKEILKITGSNSKKNY